VVVPSGRSTSRRYCMSEAPPGITIRPPRLSWSISGVGIAVGAADWERPVRVGEGLLERRHEPMARDSSHRRHHCIAETRLSRGDTGLARQHCDPARPRARRA
jgi:hypothetical protein